MTANAVRRCEMQEQLIQKANTAIFKASFSIELLSEYEIRERLRQLYQQAFSDGFEFALTPIDDKSEN
ncbi:hypothetical protein C8N29_101314 [Agitococcus lubricus]|uniref:Uncharacterized protein n=2 Tax=Agitococcus lubricus TaxID=1077255 RepID=A0A2T5J3R9_9GAMM|nr:hypothetical protein C8N29_101314 [Agitococcus lubricus]